MDYLRFATAGSVDDGKSTLIGRLLYDSKQIFEDQLAAVERSSRLRGDGYTNLALLTDGLRAEREQGITIDVAYRYFSTPRRKFIIADTPGHVQYTRNMVTGASTADAALVLVDARHGLVEQTRRHATLASLLRVPQLVVCINKMDLVGYDRRIFDSLVAHFLDFSRGLSFAGIYFLPVSALHGDNVVERSANMGWYEGPSLLEYLESLPPGEQLTQRPARFPVQWVVRPMSHEHHDYRGYAGQVAAGTLSVGDEVVVLPSGRRTRITAIDTFDGPLQSAGAPQSVSLRLSDELDVGRGDLICPAESRAQVAQELEATVCWLSETPLRPGQKLALKHTTRSAKAVVTEVFDKLEVQTLAPGQAGNAGRLELNEIAQVRLRTSVPLAFDPYQQDRTTGSFILVDEATHATVGAGMIR